MTAQRVICPEPGRVELEDFDLPAPGDDQVLVQTEVTLISPGTERAWFLKEEDAPVRFPYRPGYCHVGRVTACGGNVTRVREGDRVVSHASHASAAVLGENSLTVVPPQVSPEAAAFAPLTAISLQGVRKGGIELGSCVAVLGLGVIGLLAVKLARLSGAFPLVACDLSGHRRAAGLLAGAGAAVSVDELAQAGEALERRQPMDPGFDVIIDATGHPSAVSTAIAAAASRGRIILLGSTRGHADNVSIYEIHRKGLRIIGAHNRNRPRDVSYESMWTSRDDLELIVRMLRDGLLKVRDLITDRVRPGQVPDAFERMRQRDERMLGCVIEWSAD